VTIDVKICGLNSAAAVEAAVKNGARMTGFVFFKLSPRYVEPATAAGLSARIPAGILRVGLVVDADDAYLDQVLADVRLDLLQLHGEETPERVAAIRKHAGLPVMKAIAIAGPDDVKRAHEYEAVADRLLFDAKAPPGATRPGGNALAFDWKLIGAERWTKPWLLAGGLTVANLIEAVGTSRARGVDVSSGVEDSAGVKNAAKIEEFLSLAKSLH
jgi:phosphoribosylanthranilate isomerase